MSRMRTGSSSGAFRHQREQMYTKLEQKIAAYFGRRHCVLTGSGTTALYTIFKALELPENTKVLYPDITCETALNASIYAGLSPVFCDIDPKTFNLDIKRTLSVIEQTNARVIVPTHIFGNIMDMSGQNERFGDRDVFVIEDAAQAYGGECDGIKVGRMGEAAIISFNQGKLIDCGGGGAVLTDSDALCGACRRVCTSMNDNPSRRVALKNEYMKEMFKLTKQDADAEDFPVQRDALQRKYKDIYLFRIEAPVLQVIERVFYSLDAEVADRRKKVGELNTVLEKNKWVVLPRSLGSPVLWRYSFLVKGNRDVIFDSLLQKGIQASKLFPPLHRLYGLQDTKYRHAVTLYDRIINICLDFDAINTRNIARTIEDIIDEHAA